MEFLLYLTPIGREIVQNVIRAGYPVPWNKVEDIKKSVKSSTASYQMEHEAYWMEDKPEKTNYVLKKYCF